MNARSASPIVRLRRRPIVAMAIWIIDATAIVLLCLVVMVLNEFKHHPHLEEATAT